MFRSVNSLGFILLTLLLPVGAVAAAAGGDRTLSGLVVGPDGIVRYPAPEEEQRHLPL